jgi:hypothetical protein
VSEKTMNTDSSLEKAIELTSTVADDRISRYQEQQLTISPRLYFKEVRGYWVAAILLSLTSTVMMASSISITLKKNSESKLNFVRVDGVKVEESFDIRRTVLIENSIQREKIINQEAIK